MEETQVVTEMPKVEFKIDSTANNMTNDSEEIIEYCLEAATNITQPVKNDGDHDTFSDEGHEKVLTTLETMQTDNQEDEEPYTTYEIEDLPLNDQSEQSDEPVASKDEKLSASEIARLQLESLGPQKVGRPKKSQVTIIDEKGNVSSNKLCLTDESKGKKGENNSVSERPVASNSPVTLITPILTKEVEEIEVCEAVMIPVDELSITSTTNDGDATIETRISNMTESPGVIEIPKELITGSALTSPMFVQNTSKTLQNEDLLAILEGNDDSFEENKSAETGMSPEEEKDVALKQMMSLPVHPRGRRPNSAKAKQKKEIKPKTTNLVNSLVSDWSDNDSKKGESEGESEKPKQTPKSSKPAVINQQIDNERTERRSRIIKKKIIWDPDAPETSFSYASLVQSSAPKKPKIVQTKAKDTEEPNEVRKRKSDSASPATVKKKRVGEIDKLLADEGAINILNALKHENNNADLTESDNISVEKSPSKRIARKANSETNDASSPRLNDTPKQDTTNQKSARKPKSATVAVKKEPKKRGPNKSAASSWDYIYNDSLGQRGDDSMIIRRRSNSSYSSTASLRLSIEAPPSENDKVAEANEKTFEFAKPTVKKNSASETSPQRQLILTDLRGKVDKKGSSKADGESVVRRSSRAAATENLDVNNVKSTVEPQKKQETTSNKRKVGGEKGNDTTYNEISVQMMKQCAHIVLAPSASGKLRNSFSVQMMEEVTRALKDLSTNSAVRAVLISSSNDSFCNGINFSSLVQGTVDKRKQSATELSTALRDFITSIAKFKKLLIAGVHGHTVGIGVTILPLFDIIFASNKASFSTPYAKIGQVPENGTVFVKSNKISHRLKTELLYLNETIKATDALQNGLITKVFNSDIFESEIVHQTEQIAQQSSQFMETTKSLINFDIIDNKLDDELAKEQKLLIQHWATSECHDRFKNYLLKEKWQN